MDDVLVYHAKNVFCLLFCYEMIRCFNDWFSGFHHYIYDPKVVLMLNSIMRSKCVFFMTNIFNAIVLSVNYSLKRKNDFV